MTSWVPPESFAEYRLLRKLGDGAMGQVYLALDSLLDRHVAVKFIASVELTAVRRERLLIEARAAARLQHPNVATVHRVGELSGRPYLVSEFVRGESLDKVPKPMPWERVLELGIGLARGLAAAHRSGVLHRDIKPANAMLTSDGEVKLIDFGLAKLVEAPLVPPPPSPMESREDKEDDATISRANDQVRLTGPSDQDPRIEDATLSASGEEDTLSSGIDATDVRGGRLREELSQTGFLMGTPHYLAAELWAGQNASVRSDIYALGALLYELATGRPPHYSPNSPKGRAGVFELAERARTTDARPLAEVAKDVDPRLGRIIDRCLKRDPQLRFASSDQLLEALLEVRPGALPGPSIPEGNPYRGLHAFDAEHRALFFGRRAEVRTVLERLRREPFVLVTGDSGAGKSSLCRAGVLPLLIPELEQPRRWSIVEMVPGRRPMLALGAALAPHLGDKRSPPDFDAIMSLLQRHHQSGAGLIVFIDQLEELVSLSDGRQSSDCAAVLGLLTGAPGVRLLATARSDFLTRLAGLPGLGDEITRAIYVLRPMTAENIKEAIVGPAEAMGFRFETEDEVDLLVKSAMSSAGGLPLLQFALAELWELRDRDKKVIAHGDLVAIGGVEGALARHADHALRSLLPAERAAARRALTSLVTSEGTRARQPHDVLVGGDRHAQAAIDALVRARLVVARAEETGTDYELAHEALINGWGQLKALLRNDADRRGVKERMARAAAEWQRLGDDELLFREKQLLELERFDMGDLQSTERAFLDRSREQMRRNRLRRWAFGLGAAVTAVMIAAAVTINARFETERRVLVRLGTARTAMERATSLDAEVESLRASAFSRFDEGDLEHGESIWAESRRRASVVAVSLAIARRELEVALAIDSTRSDVRGLLISAEMLRAHVAERDLAQDVLDDALSRLAEWDSTQASLAYWKAPARLRVDTHPVKAHAMIGRFAQPPHEHWPLETESTLGDTPIAEFALAPGSYLLTLEAKGYRTVRYPILLGRDESRSLDVLLIEQTRVPEGFAYIPAGDFMSGSASEDALRRTFDKTVPIHRARTGPFLIALHETTYAEWIAFLEATHRKESGGPWPLGVRRRDSGTWELGIRQGEGGVARTVRLGQTVDVGGARFDWSRWPVNNVSVSEAEAYFEWLSRTERVLGARLCREPEWERAARGADARIYPHGDKLDPQDANFYDTGLVRTRHEVGAHPASRSPFGVDDLVGNLWEMVDPIDKNPAEITSRGGAFFTEDAFTTVTLRVKDARSTPLFGVGLRVCADVM